MKLLKITAGLSLSVLLAACVPHWSATQCTQIDMKQQGIMDGRAGMNSSRFAKYQTDCNRYSINLKRSEYRRGWRIGNRDYCHPNNLYQVGRNGTPYPSVCGTRPIQRNAYNRGRKLYTAMTNIQMKIASIDAQLNKTQRLQGAYNNTISQLASNRATIQTYKHPKNDYERELLNQARANLATEKIKAQTLHDELIAANAVEMADPERRNDLIFRRQHLERRLSKLETQG